MLKIIITLTLLLAKRSQATFGVCLDNIIKQSSRYNAVIQSPKRIIDVPLEIPSNWVSSENAPSLGLLENKPKSFTVTYDNILEFEKTVMSISTLNFFWDTTRSKFIIIAKGKEDIPQLVEIIWKYRCYKSMILFETEIYQIDFENIKCGTEIGYKRIGKCTDKTLNNLQLFPPMKRYFENCPLRVIWSRSEPWVIDVTSTSEPGIFVEFIDVFKKGSRFNVTFSPKNDDYVKELIEKYRFDTLLEDFDSGNADLYVHIGSYYLNLRVSYIKIFTNNLYIIAPKPQQLAYWKAVYLIYSLPSWIALIATYFTVSFIVYFLSRKSDEARSSQSDSLMLYVLTMTLGIGYHKTPKLSRLRIMAGSYLIFGFITSAITQGKLYSFISKPMYQKPTRNIEDLLNSGIPVKSHDPMKISFMFKNGLYDELLRKTESINSSLSLLNIANEAYKDQFATVIDEGVFILQPSLKKNMQYFDHVRYITTFNMPINHVLYECIDDMIQRMIETGILEALISKWRFIYNTRNRMEDAQIETSFTFTQLEPALFVLSLGYGAAFIVFISEYFLYYLHCFRCFT